MVAVIVLIALSGLASSVTAEPEATPVDKVVDLIRALQGKLEADQSTEQAAFDKLACWCEETTDRKAADIQKAMQDIKRLGTNILSLKGKVAVLHSEIGELKQTTQDNEKSQAEATTLREKNNKRFLEAKEEMEATIGSLEKAILRLSGAGTKTASLLQQKENLQASRLVLQKAVQALPLDNALSPKKMKTLADFIQRDPAEYYDQKAQKSAAYSPASATIQGLLKDMYDTFVSNLEQQTVSESDQQYQFEELIAAKTKEHNTLVATTVVKASEKAEAEVMLADSSEEMDDTTKVMKENKKFFEDTKAECTTKADEWSERVRSRTEELDGIKKGIEILTSDEAKELFAKAIKPGKETMLLQVVGGAREEAPVKAAEELKRVARKQHSLRLAVLATRVRGGHFDKVVEMIDNMVEMIKKEQKDDEIEREWCKAETTKNEEEASKYEYKVERMVAKQEQLEDQVTAMEAVVRETVAEMEEIQQEMQQLQDERNAEKDAMEEAKSNDEGAIEILERAIATLRSFYGNNAKTGTEMGEVQGSVKLLQKKSDDPAKPEFAPSEAGSRRGESKGIVSILTMLKEDLEDEIKNAVKNDEASQKAFENEISESVEAMERLRARKANLDDSIATANDSADDAHQDENDAAEMKAKDEEYLSQIRPDCEWMLENFDARTESRAEETRGLFDAKALLEGAIPESYIPEEGAGHPALEMLQTKRTAFLHTK